MTGIVSELEVGCRSVDPNWWASWFWWIWIWC